MKLTYLTPLLGLFLGACQSAMESIPAEAAWRGEVQLWGTLREALRDGQDEGRVALATMARDGVYGVGALEGLRGEVTILDGAVWISEGRTEAPVTRREAGDAEATVLFAAEVDEWLTIPVAEAVDPSVLDSFLAEQARAVGLDPDRPFPFVVEGALSHLHMHVIAGECPMRARMMGAEMTAPPYDLHADRIDGQLVGIYAADGAGILSHMGSRTHVHGLVDRGDGGMTGHVETVGIAAGATLKLPRS